MNAQTVTVEQACRQADSTIGHARSCKQAPDDCARCKLAIAFYASLPLAVLAVVLADRPTTKSRV